MNGLTGASCRLLAVSLEFFSLPKASRERSGELPGAILDASWREKLFQKPPGAIWERFWSDLGPPGPQKTLKNAVLSSKFEVFAIFQGSFKKKAKKLPNDTPGRPKWSPGAPREAPGAAQERPRRPQEAPGAHQERPKSPTRGEKKEQKRSSFSVRSWGGSREASGSDFGAIFEPPGEVFGAIFGRFSAHFSKHSRCSCLLFSARVLARFGVLRGTSGQDFQASGRNAAENTHENSRKDPSSRRRGGRAQRGREA